MKLLAVAEEYVTSAGRMRTASSVKTFMKEAKSLHNMIGPGASLEEVTPALLTAWCTRGDHPAPNTVKSRRGIIRGFFGWCVYKEYLVADPAAGLNYSVHPGNGPVKTHTWLTKGETVGMVRALPEGERGERDRLILMFGALCGLRAQEICNLRWEHFAPDFSTFETNGKGNKLATLGAPPELRSALLAWDAKRPVDAVAVFPTMRTRWVKERHANVPVVDWQRPIQYAGVYDVIRHAGESVGHKVRPHDLRRTFAGILETDGVSVTDIQRAMRHSNVGTTSRYLESNPSRTVEATAGLRLGL